MRLTDTPMVSDIQSNGETMRFDLSTDIPIDSGLDLQSDVEMTPVEVVPECQPGDGCLLDPCTDNDQCLSGFCLEHLGEGACTVSCIEECPPGWHCQEL